MYVSSLTSPYLPSLYPHPPSPSFLLFYILLSLLKIARLQASYEKSVSEKEELTQNIGQTQSRLKRAAKLTTGLADEQVRWAESVKVNSIGYNQRRLHMHHYMSTVIVEFNQCYRVYYVLRLNSSTC